MNLNDLIRTSLSNDSNTGEAKKAQEEIYKRAMAGDPQASNIIRSVASSPNLQAQWKAPLIKFPDSPIRSTSNEFVRSTYRDAGPVQGRDPDPIGTAIKNDPLNQQGFVFGNQDDRRAYMANPDKQPGSGKSIYQRLTPQEYGALNLASQAGDAAAKNELRQRVKEGQIYTMDSAAAQALKANATAEAERDYEPLRQKAIQDFEQRFAAQPTTNQYIPAGQPVPGKPGSIADGKGGFSYPNSNRSVFDQQGEGWLPGSPQANQALYTRSLQAPTLAERNAATKQLADIAMSGNPEARAMVDKIRGADTKPRSSRPSSGANTPDRGNTAMIRPQTNAFDQYRQNQNISASGSGPRKTRKPQKTTRPMTPEEMRAASVHHAKNQISAIQKALAQQDTRNTGGFTYGGPRVSAADLQKHLAVLAKNQTGAGGGGAGRGGGGGGRRGGGRGGSGGRGLTAKERNDLADKRASQAAEREDKKRLEESYREKYGALSTPSSRKFWDDVEKRKAGQPSSGSSRTTSNLNSSGFTSDQEDYLKNPKRLSENAEAFRKRAENEKDPEKKAQLNLLADSTQELANRAAGSPKKNPLEDIKPLSDQSGSTPTTPASDPADIGGPNTSVPGTTWQSTPSAGTGGSGQGDASGALIGWLKKRKLGLV